MLGEAGAGAGRAPRKSTRKATGPAEAQSPFERLFGGAGEAEPEAPVSSWVETFRDVVTQPEAPQPSPLKAIEREAGYAGLRPTNKKQPEGGPDVQQMTAERYLGLPEAERAIIDANTLLVGARDSDVAQARKRYKGKLEAPSSKERRAYDRGYEDIFGVSGEGQTYAPELLAALGQLEFKNTEMSVDDFLNLEGAATQRELRQATRRNTPRAEILELFGEREAAGDALGASEIVSRVVDAAVEQSDRSAELERARQVLGLPEGVDPGLLSGSPASQAGRGYRPDMVADKEAVPGMAGGRGYRPAEMSLEEGEAPEPAMSRERAEQLVSASDDRAHTLALASAMLEQGAGAVQQGAPDVENMKGELESLDRLLFESRSDVRKDYGAANVRVPDRNRIRPVVEESFLSGVNFLVNPMLDASTSAGDDEIRRVLREAQETYRSQGIDPKDFRAYAENYINQYELDRVPRFENVSAAELRRRLKLGD